MTPESLAPDTTAADFVQEGEAVAPESPETESVPVKESATAVPSEAEPAVAVETFAPDASAAVAVQEETTDAVQEEEASVVESGDSDSVPAEESVGVESSETERAMVQETDLPVITAADAAPEEEASVAEPGDTDAGLEPGAAALVVATTDPVRDYLSAIENAESDYGAYGTALADLYQGLGRSLLDQEKFEEAKKAYQRGLQIERVNFGLNSLEQQSYLYAIANIDLREDDWNATEDVLQNIYVINANNFGERNPAIIGGLYDLIRWYVESYRSRSPVNGFLNLVRAESLAQQMEGIIEHQYGLHHPNTTKVLRETSRLHYYMLGLLSQYGEIINMELAPYTGSRPDSFRGNHQSVTDNLMRMGVENYSKIIDSIENQDGITPLEYVEAIARLGDWHLIFGQRQTAGKIYQQAYEVLAKSENPEPELAEYFAQPRLVSLAETEHNSRLEASSEGEEPKTVQVSMTIESSGRPHDIEVLDPPEFMTKQLMATTEQSVSRLPFRPRLDNGKPVQTKGFILNYPIENESADEAEDEAKS